MVDSALQAVGVTAEDINDCEIVPEGA